MQKREAKLQTRVTKLFRSRGMEAIEVRAGVATLFSSGAVELKTDRGSGRVSYSAIEEGQIFALLDVAGYAVREADGALVVRGCGKHTSLAASMFTHKISDSAIGVKPFDMFYIARPDCVGCDITPIDRGGVGGFWSTGKVVGECEECAKRCNAFIGVYFEGGGTLYLLDIKTVYGALYCFVRGEGLKRRRGSFVPEWCNAVAVGVVRV